MLKTLLCTLAIAFGLSSHAQLKVELKASSESDKIKDATIEAEVSGGAPPYKYVWSEKKVSVYDWKAVGLSEGAEYTVKVVDSRGNSKEATVYVEANSLAEKMHANMTPAVGAVANVFFWDPFNAVGLYDPTIMISSQTIGTPLSGNEEVNFIVLKDWLVPDGSEVEDGQSIATLSTNVGELHLYAIGNGKLNQKVQQNDTLKYVNQNKETTVNVAEVALVEFDEDQPLQNANGSDKTTDGIPLVVLWLVIGAIIFTIYMRFVNFRGAKHAIQLVSGKYDDPNDKGEVSHFQALTTALSGTVGLGNIGGVAVAIAMGGAGATFWMILAGLLGMTSKFVECTLGVKYREIDSDDGEVHGGPMYYLSKGLSKRNLPILGKILAGLFAVLCIGGSFGGGNMFQANQAFSQFSEVVGGWEGGGPIFGIIVAVLVGIVIVGGIRSIANVTDKIVPLMVGVYVLFALIIIFMNIGSIGDAFGAIFNGAFSPDALKGGVVGVLIIGFQRAAFSNEAGVGSASIAHSAAKTNEPVSEGIVALLEPFIDTVVVCTMTALVLIFTGFADNTQGLEGANLTAAAFSAEFSWFNYVLTVAIILFAFSTMISWSYYGLKAWTYLFGRNKAMDYTYKIIFLLFIVLGSSVGLGAVLDFSDMMVLGMAFPNILGLLIMAPEVKKDMKDYFARVKSGAIKKFG